MDTVVSPMDYLRKVARPSGFLRAVAIGGWALVWLGVFLLGFVVHQLFITDLFAGRAQDGLENDLTQRNAALVEVVAFDPATQAVGAEVELSTDLTRVETTLPGDELEVPEFTVDVEQPVLLREPVPEVGEALGRMRIPSIDVWWTAVEGVSRPDLKKGPGHMPSTPLPGQPGNAVISGHRTTYGAPFNALDELQPGDVIFWDSPVIGTSRYVVREMFVVKPSDVWVTEPLDGAWLTLTTCNPEFSARERLIVRAELLDGPNADVIFGSTT